MKYWIQTTIAAAIFFSPFVYSMYTVYTRFGI